jgi:hypothetical protein
MLDARIRTVLLLHRYQVEDTLHHALLSLVSRLRVDDVCCVLSLADHLNVSWLRDACCDFIRPRLSEVMEHESWKTLSAESMSHLLRACHGGSIKRKPESSSQTKTLKKVKASA